MAEEGALKALKCEFESHRPYELGWTFEYQL